MKKYWKNTENVPLSGGIRRIKCKFEHDDKKCETSGIKYKYCDCFLEYKKFKDNRVQMFV